MFLGYWLPLMNSYSAEWLELSSYKINGSLTKAEQFYRAYSKRCLLWPPSLLSQIGTLNLLDEECWFPKATDQTYVGKLRNLHVQLPKFD
ncbi:unnamed protein product [Rotaria sordida]|uniref:Uncharacterized protein n=1 Tax=Rotaria sordida TaxID=392033 RepID=A0A815RTN6_9BILA|nr:unnamed protein product [Rotaria sordida]